VLNEIGNYSEYLPICDDQELILRTAVKTKMARVHKLSYIQYMNDGWNNFSLIRNSEINRLGPEFIVPQAYAAYKIDDRMKELGAFEEHGSWEKIWKRPGFVEKYANTILNFDVKRQYCILGYKTLIDCIEELRTLYTDTGNDFVVLDNSMSKEELCGKLDALGFDRMRCYAMSDCTWDELRAYFLLICKKTDTYVIWNSIESACSIPHMTSSLLEPDQSVQECTVETASDQSLESPALE
jgi:hypothetical protein